MIYSRSKYLLVHIFCLLFCISLSRYTLADTLKIQYSLTPKPPSAAASASTHIQLLVSGISTTNLQFQMPVWCFSAA